jgi:hypothetical protein
VRDIVLTYEVEAASTRLAASGTGRLALTDEMDAELSFRVTDTSLDPYLRAFAFQPQLSPFTSAVASGAIRIVGELYNPDALRVDVEVDDVDLRFFDYQLRNAGAIRMSVDRQVLQIDALRLVGEDTELDLAGSVDLPKRDARADGQRRGQPRGAAGLRARRAQLRPRGGRGPHRRHRWTPAVSGTALLTDGRLRHFSAALTRSRP